MGTYLIFITSYVLFYYVFQDFFFHCFRDQEAYFVDYYIKPYCRMGPYIIGVVTGYILYKTNCRFRMNRVRELPALSIIYFQNLLRGQIFNIILEVQVLNIHIQIFICITSYTRTGYKVNGL